jgi:formate dehydrogenase maturation protein FdhE
VALNDIFLIVRPNENVHFFNKIFRKHVDFLLVEPPSFKPAVGVELVKPIGRNETREQDQFMDELFVSAGLPLVHVPSGEKYPMTDLVELFRFAIAKAKTKTARRAAAELDSVPMCPVCGRMMVLRIHRSGPNSGKRYYGCMDSPKCNGLVKID